MGFINTEIQLNPGNDATKSKCKDSFGVAFYDEDGKLINGEKRYYDGTIVRYVNGLIDGNIYDSKGKIIYTMPAVKHKKGIEYWEKGWPQGSPAIIFNRSRYEEYWENQQLKKIEVKKKEELIYFSGTTENIVSDVSYGYSCSKITEKEEYVEEHGIDYYLLLDVQMPFKDRLIHITRIKNIKFPDLYNSIDMDPKAFDKVKNSKPFASIPYDKAVMIALELQLSFDEMVKFINFSGNGFRNYGKRDEIVREFFEKGNYKIFELNMKLGKENEKVFGHDDEEKKSKSKSYKI